MADFGLAETILESETNSADAYKSGTTGYLAPEILAGKSYGTASDIWSLGCLLYAMLTVTLPFSIPKDEGYRNKNHPTHRMSNYSQLDLNTVDCSNHGKDLL